MHTGLKIKYGFRAAYPFTERASLVHSLSQIPISGLILLCRMLCLPRRGAEEYGMSRSYLTFKGLFYEEDFCGTFQSLCFVLFLEGSWKQMLFYGKRGSHGATSSLNFIGGETYAIKSHLYH